MTEEEDVKNRWMEIRLNTIPECTNSEEEPPILSEEVAKAIEHFKDGKANGYDSMTADPGKYRVHFEYCTRNVLDRLTFLRYTNGTESSTF